ncbi:MAG: CDP-alcohol phosphatidyltransferase family protein [Lentisphaeria bacterium]|nr:CDP-alcohol phosphatidyltransferase family protein [Lentisphaeria bacterium]
MIKKIKSAASLKWMPNFLTLCNSLCGFAAILYILRVYEKTNIQGIEAYSLEVYAVSAYIILGAMIFDALDGFVARLLNAASLEGVEMDSLSDMVTFGLAPATLVAVMTHAMIVQRADVDITKTREVLIYCLCSIYIGGAALRLARYNIKAMFPDEDNKVVDKNYFSGLPSPGAAAAICAVVLVAPHLNISLKFLSTFLPIYAAFLGLLMVSNIPYRHAARYLVSATKSKRKMLFVFFVILTMIIWQLKGIAFWVTIYIFSGIFNLAIITFRKKKEIQ